MHPTTALAIAGSRRADDLCCAGLARTRRQLLAARRAERLGSLSAALRVTLRSAPPAASPVCCAA
jgi:hypothetical protein